MPSTEKSDGVSNEEKGVREVLHTKRLLILIFMLNISYNYM